LGAVAMKNLDEGLQFLLNAFLLWLQFILKPVATLNSILLETADEKRLSAAMKIWVPSLLIGVFISIPVLQSSGIVWYEAGYHLSNWMVSIIGLVASAFIVHQILLLVNLRSEFVGTLVMYTVVVTIQGPVVTLLSIPATLYNVAAVQHFKQQSTPIGEAIFEYFRSVTTLDYSILQGIQSVAGPLISVVSFIVLTLFAESISQWYGNNRFKSYSAVAAGMVLSTFVSFLVIIPMQFLIIFAFVHK
jgi:hypothetical protein